MNLYLDSNYLKAEIAKLIEHYPELAEDESLRADVLEGETDLHRIITEALEQRQEAESMANAIKEREEALYARRGRFERKSEAMKHLIRSVMKAAGQDKIVLPEASLFITKPSMSVGIDRVEDLPQGFFKTERKADKTAIKAAFAAGEDVPGAFKVLGSEGLMVRVK